MTVRAARSKHGAVNHSATPARLKGKPACRSDHSSWEDVTRKSPLSLIFELFLAFTFLISCNFSFFISFVKNKNTPGKVDPQFSGILFHLGLFNVTGRARLIRTRLIRSST